jgi:hypothetical protein
MRAKTENGQFHRRRYLTKEILKSIPDRTRWTCEPLETRTLLAGLVIVPTFAASITSDPQAATIEATINSAIKVFEAWFATPITVNITFQEGTTGLGGSSTFGAPFAYTTVRADLAAKATTPDALAAVASLPVQTNNPTNNNANVRLSSANARALGINFSPPAGTPDSLITLNTSICNLSRASNDPTKYDLMAVASHEMDEALGFGSVLDLMPDGSPTPTGAVTLDDMFRYDQFGSRSFNTLAATQAYFSVDGGVTTIAQFNQNSTAANPGDFADWDSTGIIPRVQDAFATAGATPDLGPAEFRRLNVHGYTLNFAALINGVLQVSDIWGQSSPIIVSQTGPNILVQDIGGNQEFFPTAQISSIIVDGNDGDDPIDLESNGGIPTTIHGDTGNDTIQMSNSAGNLSSLPNFVDVDGDAGFDTLVVNDSNSSATNTYNINAFSVSRPGFGGVLYDVEALSFTSGTGSDTVNFSGSDVATPVTVNSHGGHDTVNIGTDGGAQFVKGDVTIKNSPSFSTINIDDSADAVARAPSISNGSIFGLAPGAIFWATSDISAINIIGGSGGNSYFVQSGPTSFSEVLNTGSGNDTVAFENDAPGLFTVNGQAGTDSVYVFDSNAIAQTYSITGAGISRSGLTVGLGTVESLNLFAGDAADTINFSTSIQYGLSIDGGGAGDTFNIGSPSQAQFFGNVALIGGAGDDNFIWKNASNNWYDTSFGTLHFNVSIDGGIGFNSLSMDDTTRGNANYQFYADRIYVVDPAGFAVGSDFTYDNLSAIGLTASNGNNPLAVFGVSSDIVAGNQVTIVLNGGNDTVTVYPHDAMGNLTINGNIGIVGGTGTDSITFDDTGATGGIDYSFSNPFGSGTQDVFGMGLAGLGYTSDFENATIKGGDGDDTFDINQYKAGTPLGIYGGGGNDTLNFGGGNLPVNITSIAAFGFDGQSGFDTFNVNNTGDANQWTYTAQLTTIQSQRVTGTAYSAILSEAGIELLNINPGAGTNVLNLNALASGESIAFYGNTGTDALNLPGSLSAILGPVYFYGNAGTNNINELNNSATVDTTVHLDAAALGAGPGDNFFPAGGALFFDSVTNMTITLGSGVDTAYATPNITAAVNIRGGSPTTAPGDTLVLELGEAVNYVLHGTASSGSVTSDNLKTLSYSGFETGPTIEIIAPVVTASVFDWTDSAQDLAFTFTQRLIDPGAQSLQLVNESTGETVSDGITETYDGAALTATFAFATDSLAPGIYQATLPAANFQNVAGVPLAADFVYTFLWVPSLGALALPAGSGAVRVQQIAIATGGTFDLADNALVLDYDGATPLPAIQAYLAGGFNQGTWDGAGINSSAAVNDPSQLTGIGYAEASDLGIDNFAGLPVDSSAVVIRYTNYGDNNLDGVVDIGNDFGLLLDGLATNGSLWIMGDYTYDGKVDLGNDFNLFLVSYLSAPAPAVRAARSPAKLASSGAAAAAAPAMVAFPQQSPESSPASLFDQSTSLFA